MILGANTIVGVDVGGAGRAGREKSAVAVINLQPSRERDLFEFSWVSVAAPSIDAFLQKTEPWWVVLVADPPDLGGRIGLLANVNRSAFWERACAGNDIVVVRVSRLVLEQVMGAGLQKTLSEIVGRKLEVRESLALAASLYVSRLFGGNAPLLTNLISNVSNLTSART